jgi:pyridoxine 5-phosphate synthase
MRQIETARLLGAVAVELQTARYSEAKVPADFDRELAALEEASAFAREQKLHVHMGHGLNYWNVPPLIGRIPAVEELNIGHSIVARAVLVGMERAVREMREAIEVGRKKN